MHSFSHQGREYPITLAQRRNHRRLRLTIDNSGNIRLSAPLRISQQQILAFLQEHQHWLSEQLSKIPPLEERYAAGSEHFFLGKKILLNPILGRGSQLSGNILTLGVKNLAADTIATALLTWYKRQAEQLLPPLVAQMLPLCAWVKTAPPIRLRAMRRQWANCASRGHLTFNTHLIKAAPKLICHVIAHELCHLKEFNHSAAFYTLMQEIDPAWQHKAQQLQTLSRLYLP